MKIRDLGFLLKVEITNVLKRLVFFFLSFIHFSLEVFLKIFIPNSAFQDYYFFLPLANFRLPLSERKMCHLTDCKTLSLSILDSLRHLV